MRKSFSEPAPAGSFYHDGGVNVHRSSGKRNVDDLRKDYNLSHNEFSLEESQLRSSYMLGKVYAMFGFEPLHSLHLGIAILEKNERSGFLIQIYRSPI